MAKNIDEFYEAVLCPICDCHYRKLVKFYDDIILYCDACLSFWINPNEIDYENGICATYNDIINITSANHDEIIISLWNNLYENNPFYLPKNRLSLPNILHF
ncbi:hypothetical protein [Moumouvirus maliensis]|nr:hypothetical protein [Moumouvirus maliensis]